MRKPSKTSIDYYIFPNKILCSMIGMWPIEKESPVVDKIFAYFRLTFSLTAVSSVLVPEILIIATNWGDLRILTEVGCVLTTVGQLLFKMIYLMARREKTYRLYKELRSLWDTSDDSKERRLYEQFAQWARITTIVFYSSCMCNVFTFTIAAAIDYIRLEYNVSVANNARHLPFEVWYGMDIAESPSFEIAFVCQVLASLICCAGISGLDASFMTIILHMCGQFKLINAWISNIGRETNDVPINRRSNYSPDLKADLIRCIRHHQRAINLVNEINNLLTPIIFMQLLTSGIEICLSGFTVFDNGVGTDLLKFISYLTSMMVQILLWCWPGEILIQESQDIGHAIYLNIPWYYLPPIYRRQLCLIIVRTQRFCRISALTFDMLSFHTLTTVFNTAASYFTLLRQMQQT